MNIMKYNFICEGGRHNNFFMDKNTPPEECSYCFEKFDFCNVVEVENPNLKKKIGLKIIYQLNQQYLEISTLHKYILGRDNYGSSFFSEINYNGEKVVSRKHCSIEFKDDNFYLLDEDSKYGTKYGINKISCKNSPQIIEDNSIFYIGKEPFLAIINYEESEKRAPIEILEEKVQKKANIIYRCNELECGYESQIFIQFCPLCNTCNSLKHIHYEA